MSLDRREGTKVLAIWAAFLAAVLPVVLGLISFFWGQASAANERIATLEKQAVGWDTILKSIDKRLEHIENRLKP